MKTTIKLERLNDAVHFKATNSRGVSILMDGTKDLGGNDLGVRPMENLLMSLAGCSAIDIVFILGKMRQSLDDIQLEVSGDVKKIDDHKIYANIHMHFRAWGDIKEAKLKKAVELSVEKYCSVAKILEKSANITHSFELNPEN